MCICETTFVIFDIRALFVSSESGLSKMSEVSLPTDIIELFSVSSLLSSTHAFLAWQINKRIAATAGKTRGIITPRGIKHSFSGGESDREVFSSLSCRTMKTFYDKLMHSVTHWGHTPTHCSSPTHTPQTDAFLNMCVVFNYVISKDPSTVSQHKGPAFDLDNNKDASDCFISSFMKLSDH